MTLMLKLIEYKKYILIGLAMLLSLAIMPAAQVSAVDEDVFGMQKFQDQTDLGKKDFTTTIAEIINVALSLLGIVAVVIILIGGFKWMTSGGDETKVGDARKFIFAGVIGLAIIMSSWALATFVLNKLGSASGVLGEGGIELT
ncbi:MAG: hypothetical protein HON29_04255 [Candidatus Magasanikbacteria bacterium]|jgi:hypothetical protein|nr:hypothetical protein [Candidatus Magasanikbacteria bacterium]